MLWPHDSERFKAADQATHLLSRRRNNVTGPLSTCAGSPVHNWLRAAIGGEESRRVSDFKSHETNCNWQVNVSY